jgi:amino acid transporter
MSMSRDGLLPKIFSRIHPKFHTPSFSTIVTGFVVAVPALFLNLTVVTDLTSIGTLFAFVLVCGGVLLLPREAAMKGRFHMPYVNSKFIVPVLFVIGCVFFWKPMIALFGGENAHENFPFFLFIILSAALTVGCFIKNLSLIPVLGLLSCFYLMTQLGYDNWVRFIGWLVIGLVIYVSYGYTHSHLGNAASPGHKLSVRIGAIGGALSVAAVCIFKHESDMLLQILEIIVAGCVGFLLTYLISAAFLTASTRKKPIS